MASKDLDAAKLSQSKTNEVDVNQLVGRDAINQIHRRTYKSNSVATLEKRCRITKVATPAQLAKLKKDLKDDDVKYKIAMVNLLVDWEMQNNFDKSAMTGEEMARASPYNHLFSDDDVHASAGYGGGYGHGYTNSHYIDGGYDGYGYGNGYGQVQGYNAYSSTGALTGAYMFAAVVALVLFVMCWCAAFVFGGFAGCVFAKKVPTDGYGRKLRADDMMEV